MSATLPPEFESFINVRVSTGAYRSEADVLRAAFDLLERREQLLAHIDEGASDLRAGRFTEYGDRDLKAFVKDVLAAAAQRKENGGAK